MDLLLVEDKDSFRRLLIQALEGSSWSVRAVADPQEALRALEAAGAFDTAWVRQAISEAYESDVLRLKVSSVHAMGRSCEHRWLPLLIKELGSDEAELRYEAAHSCGELADEQAIPHLIKLIVDPDEEVKEVAIHALGQIGGRQAREALLMLLDSESDAVRDAATEALAQFKKAVSGGDARNSFPGLGHGTCLLLYL